MPTIVLLSMCASSNQLVLLEFRANSFVLHRRCNTYWTERLHKERKEQLREAKIVSERMLYAVMRP